MVYCGKPSKGCQTCRSRKIRCDQNPDGCSQCIKAQRQCPGYRVQLDLMFRNESSAVVKKAKAKEALKKRQTSPHSATTASTPTLTDEGSTAEIEEIDYDYAFLDEARNTDQTFSKLQDSTLVLSPRLQPSVMPSLVDAATVFFIQNFVIGLSPPDANNSSMIPTSYFGLGLDDHVVASMRAVGFAGFSNIVARPEIMKQARYHYMKALRLTNAALRSPTEAVKDSTLLSIMILGLFETVTGYNQKSLAAWAEHINGAGALIKLRGSEQLSTPSGLRMFIQVTSSLLISCVQRELPLPPHIVTLREEASQYVDADDPAWHLQGTVMEFVNFRASVSDGTISDPDTILAGALELDGKFANVFEDLPDSWKYETVYTEKDPDIVYAGKFHVYFDYWVAQIWNAMRSCRILLNALIRETLLKGFGAHPPLFLGPIYVAQYQVSTDILYQLRDDILASVPQHLGYEPAQTFSGPVRSFLDGNAPEYGQDWDGPNPLFGPRPPPPAERKIPAAAPFRPYPATLLATQHIKSVPAKNPVMNFQTIPKEAEEHGKMDPILGHESRVVSIPPRLAGTAMHSAVPPDAAPKAPTSTTTSSSTLPLLRGSGGYFLLWPLYHVGAMDIATEDVRKWVCHSLRSIGGTMGIFQAITLARFLERKEEMEAWRKMDDEHRSRQQKTKQ